MTTLISVNCQQGPLPRVRNGPAISLFQMALGRARQCQSIPIRFCGCSGVPAMRHVKCCIDALLVLAFVALARGAAVAAEPMQLVVNGQTRTFLLERSASAGARPTILVLHGAGGSGAREAESDLSRHGPQAGFTVVFPDGRANRWNHLPPGKEADRFAEVFRQHGGPPDDIAFLKALVADLVRGGITDPKQVYLVGTSAGGIMSLRMVCLGEETFAGIALLAASMPDATGAACRLRKALPVLVIYGTADTVVPYSGGTGVLADGTRGVYSVWGAERLVTFFRQHNGCAEPAEKSISPGYNPQKVEVERSTKCAGGPVHYYRVVGGGHNLQLQAPNPSHVIVEFFRGAAGAPMAVERANIADEQRTCFSGAAGDANIAACGRLIASNALRGGDLLRAHLHRAVLFARTGHYDRVIGDASEVLRLDPSHAEAYLLRGSSYLRRGDARRAQEDVNKAVQLGPKTGLAYNILSAYYNMTGDYERALTAANESLRVSPGNVYGRKNRAESLENKGELRQALAEFRGVLATDPQRQERAGREAAAAIQRIEQKLGVTRKTK